MKNFLIYFIKFELIALIVIFIPLAYLFMPVQVYAQHYSDNKIVRDIQLMLTQKGIHAGENKEAIKIDGIYGPQTEAGIKEYERQNNMEETGKPSEHLRSRLYEDVKSLTDNNNTNEDKKLAALAQELDETKENLKNTNEALRTITNSMSDHFINNFNNLVTLFLSTLAIVVTAFSVWLGWYIPSFQEEITDKVNEAHEKMLKHSRNHIYAGLLTQFSSHCLNLYKDLKTDTPEKKNLYDSYLTIAKNFSDLGYKKAKALTNNKVKLTEEEEKMEKLIVDYSINNKLFFTATPFIGIEKSTKNIKPDNQEVIELFNEMRNVCSSNDKTYREADLFNFKETLLWAKLHMKSYEDIKDIESEINLTTHNKRFPLDWRKEIYRRYDKFNTPTKQELNITEPTE